MNSLEELDGRLLVIFDGLCGFCNRSVRWFLRRDRGDRMRFAPSDSPKVAELLARHVGSDRALSSTTILVVRDPGRASEQVLIRSDAAVALLAVLPGPWPAIGKVFGWIPRPVRDLGYRVIAHWRYRIWGRFDACPIPTPQERGHFL
ncbi:MAG: DCC1-like thiol-disulfide oxidoreductase family protein [Terracidiphilus sp.]